MPEMSEDERAERQKKTLYLVLAGGLSLLLPALGAAYLHFRSGAGSGPAGSGTLFERRYGAALAPAQVSAADAAKMRQSLIEPVAVSPTKETNGSLGFIRGGEDYADPDKTAAVAAPKAAVPPVETSKPEAAPPPPPPPNPLAQMMAAPKAPAAPVKGRPSRLKPMKSMAPNSFAKPSVFDKQSGQKPGAAGAPDITELMKNMPQGAGGVPDMSQLLKNLPQQQAPPDGQTKSK